MPTLIATYYAISLTLLITIAIDTADAIDIDIA